MTKRIGLPLLALLLVAFALAGCGETTTSLADRVAAPAAPEIGLDPTAASGGGGGDLYPLEMGNRWFAERLLRMQLVTPGGPLPPDEAAMQVEREIVGAETIDGREYAVEEERLFEAGNPSPFRSWLRFRQDRAGLYEADMPTGIPPTAAGAAGEPVALAIRPEKRSIPAAYLAAADPAALRDAWNRLQAKRDAVLAAVRRAPGAAPSPPGGAEGNELTRLRYPLRPGQEWVIRESPLFASRVEARETLDLAPGHLPGARVRLSSSLYGPNDAVLLWYGRAGRLGHRFHLESELVDIGGNVIGVLLWDEEETLTGLDLQRNGRF